MAAISAGRDARTVAGNAVYYERHRPGQTLLYHIVEEYYPAFLDLMAAQGRALPPAVQREFEDYLRCGRLEHGFLRVRCERCHAEKLVAFSCKRRGFCPSCGARRMNGCHGHPRARCATGSRHRIEMARPMSSSSPWISSHGWRRWCPSRA